ncbi:unnamed protein product [Leuciscus chuanchicus]
MNLQHQRIETQALISCKYFNTREKSVPSLPVTDIIEVMHAGYISKNWHDLPHTHTHTHTQQSFTSIIHQIMNLDPRRSRFSSEPESVMSDGFIGRASAPAWLTLGSGSSACQHTIDPSRTIWSDSHDPPGITRS